MILYAASIVIFFFISFNLFWKADCGMILKIIGCVVLLLVSLKYEVNHFLGGAFFAPQLPRLFIIAYEALYGAFIILFFLLLLWDIYLLGNWLMAKTGIPVPHDLPKGWIKAGLVCAAIAIGGWGTWQAIKVPDVREIELRIAQLPQELDGVTLVQLSDIHIGPILGQDWLAQVVAKTNALDADLILLTGDYVDGYARDIGKELAPLADLRARYGVFAVTGNHEYYWNMPEWRKALADYNVPLLENEHKAIQINGETMVVAGIPDPGAGRFGFPGPDLAKALANAPDGVRLLLSHQPRHAEGYLEHVDLMLSGHTHGGIMFFVEPLIARFNSGFVKGLYDLAGKYLYVSDGTGLWNGFSCRIGVPAEITYFILKSGEKTDE